MIVLLIISILLSSLPGPTLKDEIHLINRKVYKVKEWSVEGDYLILIKPDGNQLKILRKHIAKIDVGTIDEMLDTSEPSSPSTRRSQPDTDVPQQRNIAIPDRVLTQVNRGNIAAALRELDTVGNGYRQTSDYSFLEGTLLIRAGYFAEAEKILSDALEKDPHYPAGRFLLAQALYYQGRWNEAEDQYRAALQANQTPEITSQLSRKLAEIKSYRDGQVISRGAFIIRLTPGYVDQTSLNSAIEILLIGVDEASRILNFRPPQKLLVTISNSSTSSYNHGGDVGNYDGKISIAISVLSAPQRKEILIHELAHALILPRTKANCPTWLQEGLAQLISGKKVEDYRSKLLAFINNSSIGLSEYPDSLALTQFLIDHYGSDKMDALLDQLANGTEASDALLLVYRSDYQNLIVERNDWLRHHFAGLKR